MQLVKIRKMNKTVFWFSFFLFVLINLQVEAKNSCNDECLSKTYCLSSDGSGVCSKNNLVTAQFKVVPVFGENDYLQITLKGYNVALDDEKTIKVSFDLSNYPPNSYTCHKSSLGSTYARFDRGTYSLTTGSSYYTDGVLLCTWIFNQNNAIWPIYHSDVVDMLRDKSQSITLYYDSQNSKVAQDTSQLPIYHAQYLKCCNKVHGNDQFQLTFDQIDKRMRYQLYYLQGGGRRVDIILARKDGKILGFTCYLISEYIIGSVSNATEQFILDDQLIKDMVIDFETCSWSTPFVLSYSPISIDASTSVFDLKVQVDSVTIYTEKDVVLRNSSCLVQLNIILISFAVFLQTLLIN